MTMKTWCGRAWVGALCLVAAGWAQAQGSFVSSMGFRSVVPSGWMALTKEEVRKNAKLFETGLASMKGANPEMLRQIESEIRGGRIELLFAPPGDPSFRDNINVRIAEMAVPSSDKALQNECNSLPAQLQQMFGRPMRMYACRFENLPIGRAVYLEFDGATEGLRSMQYNVTRVRSPDTVWQVTGTFTNATTEQQRPVFESFMQAMKALK